MISWTCFGSKLFWLPPCQAEPTGHGVIRHWTLVLRALTVCVPCLVRLWRTVLVTPPPVLSQLPESELLARLLYLSLLELSVTSY